MTTTKFATLYAKLTGLALLLIGIIGIVSLAIGVVGVLSPDLLLYDHTHNALHIVLGAVALVAGYAGYVDQEYLDPIQYGKLFGVVYLGLGAFGFATAGELFGIADAIGLHLELGENLIHVLIGAGGIVAGFYVVEPDGEGPEWLKRTEATPGVT